MYKPGKWLVRCTRCKFLRTAPDEIIKTWDGKYVCHPSVKQGCFETRHPQDFVRSKPDDYSVPYTNKEVVVDNSPTFIATTIGVQETTIPSGTFDNSL